MSGYLPPPPLSVWSLKSFRKFCIVLQLISPLSTMCNHDRLIPMLHLFTRAQCALHGYMFFQHMDSHILNNHKVSIIFSLRSRTLKNVMKFFFGMKITWSLGDLHSKVSRIGFCARTQNPIQKVPFFLQPTRGGPNGPSF